MQEIIIKQPWTEYFPMITLLAGVIGYFIKRHFDLKSERIKLRYGILQKQRTEAINLFIHRFLAAEHFWTQLPHLEVISSDMKAKELDSLIIPIMNQLTESYYALMVILSDNEISEFTKIINSIFSLKATMSKMRNQGRRIDSSRLVDEFSLMVDKVSNQNKISVKKIGHELQAALSK